MKTIFLIIALLWVNTKSQQSPIYDYQSNIIITKDFLVVKSTLGFKGRKWTHPNQKPLKMGENKFYYVLEEGLAVELTVFKYE